MTLHEASECKQIVFYLHSMLHHQDNVQYTKKKESHWQMHNEGHIIVFFQSEKLETSSFPMLPPLRMHTTFFPSRSGILLLTMAANAAEPDGSTTSPDL